MGFGNEEDCSCFSRSLQERVRSPGVTRNVDLLGDGAKPAGLE